MKKSDILSLLDEAELQARNKHSFVTETVGRPLKSVQSPPLAAEHDIIEPTLPPDPAPEPLKEPESHTEPEPQQTLVVDPVPAAKQLQPEATVEPSLPVERPTEQVVAAASADTVGTPPSPPRAKWHDHVPTSHSGVVGRGLLFVFGFLAVFLAWSLLLPISSAVVASGKIVSTGQNKLVQHQVGGVVREILVKEGDKVAEGDVLVILDDVATKAELSRLLARKQTLDAQKLRYQAEQGGAGSSFPKESSAVTGTLRGGDGADNGASLTNKAEGSAVIDEQRKEFDAGRKRLSAQLNAISFQIETLKDEKSGLQARLLGNRKLLKLTQRDLGKIRPLANDGYLPKSRLWDIEKTQLEQLTEIENLTSQIGASDQKVSEAEAKLAELDQSDREKRSEELTKVIGELAELKEPIEAARRVLQLTKLRAPASGTITNLAANTVGGVLPAGDPVAEIVPTGAQLQTEFRVPLNKSKYVVVDQPVRITMSTFNRRRYDPIDGIVSYVSADSLLDQQTGEAYFLARAKLTPNPKKATGINEVSAGMATEIYVLAGPRVFASYVLQPLIDSFNRAFREI